MAGGVRRRATCILSWSSWRTRLDSADPWVSTVHGAKGLEFRALHFAAAEFVTAFGAEQKRVAYTAVTRAKTALVIYHHRDLPPYFDSALNALRRCDGGL